jgi:hypothetical protein
MSNSNSNSGVALPPPAPGIPMVVRMVSESLKKGSEPMVFAVGHPHPLANDVKIVRMFVAESPDGVEVYSATADGTSGMRDRIPWHRILIVGEAMPLDVFVEELAIAEGEGEEEEEADQAAAARAHAAAAPIGGAQSPAVP